MMSACVLGTQREPSRTWLGDQRGLFADPHFDLYDAGPLSASYPLPMTRDVLHAAHHVPLA